MKCWIVLITAVLCTFTGWSQDRDERALVSKTRLLSNTVFGSKDSLVLEQLFAKQLSYGHSRGKVESRTEALKGILRNTSFYTDTAVWDISVLLQKKSAIVRHRFTAKEHKIDGTVVTLQFSIMLVWIREGGVWKLFGRQAVALPQ